MALDPNEVIKIAHLARLQLDADKIPSYVDNLSNILAVVAQLQSIATERVAPMAHPLDVTQRLRPDQVTETNQRDLYQQIAPATENGLYLVPKVIE